MYKRFSTLDSPTVPLQIPHPLRLDEGNRSQFLMRLRLFHLMHRAIEHEYQMGRLIDFMHRGRVGERERGTSPRPLQHMRPAKMGDPAAPKVPLPCSRNMIPNT